jgi:hypothetical protein
MRNRALPAAPLIALVALTSRPAHADERDRCASASEHAQDLRAAGKLRAARSSLLSCVPATCPSIVRNDCLKWLAEVDGLLPSIIIRATDSTGHDLIAVRVLVDGELLADGLDGKAIPVDPGPHHIRYETQGAAPVEDTILVRESEKDRILTVQLAAMPSRSASSAAPAFPPAAHQAEGATASASRPTEEILTPARHSTSSPWVAPLLLSGAGVAGLATFAILGIVGQSEYNHCDQLPPQCTSSDVGALAVRRDAAWIAGGLGVASLGAAAWLFFSRPKGGSAVAVRFGVARGATTFELAGRY